MARLAPRTQKEKLKEGTSTPTGKRGINSFLARPTGKWLGSQVRRGAVDLEGVVLPAEPNAKRYRPLRRPLDSKIGRGKAPVSYHLWAE